MVDKSDKFIGIAIIFFVGILVAGVLVPLAYSSLDKLGSEGACDHAGGSWNTSQGLCFNDTQHLAGNFTEFTSIPVSAILVSSGLMGILLIIGVFKLFVKGANDFDFSKGKR